MLKSKKEAKRLYDIEYRRKNKERIRGLKAERYKRDAWKYREREKAYRSKPEVVESHNEYCRQPEYRAKKHLYDVARLAVVEYGEFWEAAILVKELEKEVRKRIPKNERLYYRRCVDRNVARNNKRRLEKAIAKIQAGEAGPEILRFGWLEESKQLLEMEILRNE